MRLLQLWLMYLHGFHTLRGAMRGSLVGREQLRPVRELMRERAGLCRRRLSAQDRLFPGHHRLPQQLHRSGHRRHQLRWLLEELPDPGPVRGRSLQVSVRTRRLRRISVRRVTDRWEQLRQLRHDLRPWVALQSRPLPGRVQRRSHGLRQLVRRHPDGRLPLRALLRQLRTRIENLCRRHLPLRWRGRRAGWKPRQLWGLREPADERSELRHLRADLRRRHDLRAGKLPVNDSPAVATRPLRQIGHSAAFITRATTFSAAASAVISAVSMRSSGLSGSSYGASTPVNPGILPALARR